MRRVGLSLAFMLVFSDVAAAKPILNRGSFVSLRIRRFKPKLQPGGPAECTTTVDAKGMLVVDGDAGPTVPCEPHTRRLSRRELAALIAYLGEEGVLAKLPNGERPFPPPGIFPFYEEGEVVTARGTYFIYRLNSAAIESLLR